MTSLQVCSSTFRSVTNISLSGVDGDRLQLFCFVLLYFILLHMCRRPEWRRHVPIAVLCRCCQESLAAAVLVVVGRVDDVDISCALACGDVEAPPVCLRHQLLCYGPLLDPDLSCEGRRHDDGGCQQWAAGGRVGWYGRPSTRPAGWQRSQLCRRDDCQGGLSWLDASSSTTTTTTTTRLFYEQTELGCVAAHPLLQRFETETVKPN